MWEPELYENRSKEARRFNIQTHSAHTKNNISSDHRNDRSKWRDIDHTSNMELDCTCLHDITYSCNAYQYKMASNHLLPNKSRRPQKWTEFRCQSWNFFECVNDAFTRKRMASNHLLPNKSRSENIRRQGETEFRIFTCPYRQAEHIRWPKIISHQTNPRDHRSKQNRR